MKTNFIQHAQTYFAKNKDVKITEMTFSKQILAFIYCEQLIDESFFNKTIVARLEEALSSDEAPTKLKPLLHLPQLTELTKIEQVASAIFAGHLVIYCEATNELLATNIVKKPNRSPEETASEVTIKGPRDNFIEELSINIALIRKRLPTKSLAVEKLSVGKRSNTSVAILYMDDIANSEIVNGLKAQIKKIDTDIVVSGELLLETALNHNTFFPMADYTGRPDFAVQALVRGRVILLTDGVAYANIVPINLFFLTKTSEDNEFPAFFSSFERLIRVTSLLVGSFLPGVWLALTTVHPNQLPFQLLATVVQANVGLPLPSALEMLLMLFMFELFREAGLRLPAIVGSTIGVVGGLIIGDAAIRAGITSPAMIVIIATSTIATYTLVNQSLVSTVSVVRLLSIISAALFGLFGFILSFFFILLYLCNIRTFGIPYMNITADLTWKNSLKSIMRLPTKAYNKRPSMLKTKDSTRSGKK